VEEAVAVIAEADESKLGQNPMIYILSARQQDTVLLNQSCPDSSPLHSKVNRGELNNAMLKSTMHHNPSADESILQGINCVVR